MSLVDVLTRLSTGTYSVTREVPAGFLEGRPVFNDPVVLQLPLVLQPASAKELLRLPEGDRTGDVLSVWSTTELQLRDVITAQGFDWQVEQAGWWAAGGFWACLARKVTP